MSWKTIAAVSSVISLIIGVLCIYGAIGAAGASEAAKAGNYIYEYDPRALPAIIFVLGILGISAGILGLIGCYKTDKNKNSAKRLLMVAAICMIPYGLIFFVLLMTSRNRMSELAENADNKEKREDISSDNGEKQEDAYLLTDK